jgi:hypothetical protein
VNEIDDLLLDLERLARALPSAPHAAIVCAWEAWARLAAGRDAAAALARDIARVTRLGSGPLAARALSRAAAVLVRVGEVDRGRAWLVEAIDLASGDVAASVAVLEAMADVGVEPSTAGVAASVLLGRVEPAARARLLASTDAFVRLGQGDRAASHARALIAPLSRSLASLESVAIALSALTAGRIAEHDARALLAQAADAPDEIDAYTYILLAVGLAGLEDPASGAADIAQRAGGRPLARLVVEAAAVEAIAARGSHATAALDLYERDLREALGGPGLSDDDIAQLLGLYAHVARLAGAGLERAARALDLAAPFPPALPRVAARLAPALVKHRDDAGALPLLLRIEALAQARARSADAAAALDALARGLEAATPGSDEPKRLAVRAVELARAGRAQPGVALASGRLALAAAAALERLGDTAGAEAATDLALAPLADPVETVELVRAALASARARARPIALARAALALVPAPDANAHALAAVVEAAEAIAKLLVT